MRIAFDARAYSWAGVGRYVRNLIQGLAQVDTQNEYLVLLGEADKEIFDNSENLSLGENFTVKFVESSYYSWREQVFFWWQLKNIEADLWHFPNFNIPVLFNKPYVVTVHDTTRFIFPGQTSQSLIKQGIYEQVFKHAVQKAQGVIFVSQATADSLRDLPIKTPSLTSVIYEGVEARFKSPIDEKKLRDVHLLIGGDEPYLLYVGVWMNHKNIPRILEAFSKASNIDSRVKLVITGKPKPGYVNVSAAADKLGIKKDRIKFVGFVEDDLLPALYKEAEALLFPSLYEGFGLPAIEAAAVGTPVIAANTSSLPEIMGAAAVYVNPEDVEGISFAIERLLADSKYKRTIINRGLARAKEFNWLQCAEQTRDMYESVKKKLRTLP